MLSQLTGGRAKHPETDVLSKDWHLAGCFAPTENTICQLREEIQ